MTIQKKSLINNLTTTKKAIIASSSQLAPVVSNKIGNKRPAKNSSITLNKAIVGGVVGNKMPAKALNKATFSVVANKMPAKNFK